MDSTRSLHFPWSWKAKGAVRKYGKIAWQGQGHNQGTGRPSVTDQASDLLVRSYSQHSLRTNSCCEALGKGGLALNCMSLGSGERWK